MSTDAPQTPPVHHYQHDPEQNELERALNSVRKQFEPYQTQLILGAVVLVVVLAGWIYWSRSAGAVSTVGWKEFATYKAPSDFQALAEKYPTAPVANWALLEAGRRYATEGLQAAMTNRETSDESLANARTAFQKLLDKGKSIPAEIREEALFGLATSLEALSGDNIDEALSAYKALQTEFPESRHGKWVAARLAALEEPATKDFYVWFRQQNPKPADRPLPRDLQLDLPQLPPPSNELVPDTGITPPPSEGTPVTPPVSEGTPAPAEGTPAPTEGAAPTTETPPAAPTEGTPAPTEGTPAPTEGTPAPTEGTPAPAEGSPPAAGTPAPAESPAADAVPPATEN